ncbi:ABC transporter permease [Pantoea cypripedii]|uniref:ABC transporter permease n=1 Tax=Pantoea cypripedii TaxID=55209 RepID=A0A6B9G5S4_PANCY|nr:ABC transporter permease [Pantoea cypripedii]QGY32914.1 ABC transporter permease [Pantoea cypripedii]
MLTQFTAKHRWVWSCAGTLLLWGALSLVTGQFSLSSLSGMAMSASFLVLAALGQTLVVTSGRGNIDLSIAGVITFSAFAANYMSQFHSFTWFAVIGIVLVIGLVTGLVNAILVVVCHIPAIIATLATGYILATCALLTNRVMPSSSLPTAIKVLSSGHTASVPNIFILALVAVGLVGLLLNFTVYGRKLAAVGQNEQVAQLAGVNSKRIMASSFVISSCITAITGLLLASYVGGAFLEMGTSYTLQSIGAVVLGGSLIFGGCSTALGTFFGSAVLILIVTTAQIAGLPAGAQDVVQGIVIIAVLFLASGKKQTSKLKVA